MLPRLACIALLCGATWAGCGPSSPATDGGNHVDAASSVDGGGNHTDAGPHIDATPQPDGIEGCDPKDFTLQQNPRPQMYLVVDRSGSMNDPGSAPPATKWDELEAAVDWALGEFQGAIEFGLLAYPEGPECTTPGPQVLFDVNNKAAVMSEIESSVPAGGTPTAAALTNAASSLGALGAPDTPKFIILATDGGPNCNYFLSAQPSCGCTYASSPDYCCTSYPGMCIYGNSCLDDDNTLGVITHLHDDLGIDTFVIGLPGTAEYVSLLDEMALAGGKPQIGGATDYYDVANQAELQSALETIAVSVISCTLVLDEAPEQPDEVRIYIDGILVPRDITDGWDYTDDTQLEIELHGASCGTLQDGDEHVVTATFACVVG